MSRFRLLIAAAMICLLPGLHAAVSADSSWTQFQADPAHSGYIPYTINTNNIVPLWSLADTELGHASLVPGVVTDADHVYVVGRTTDGDPYEVVAVDRLSKTVAWTRGFSPYSRGLSAPATGNGKVYVHQWGHSGISGGNAAQYPYVTGLDAQTGEIDFATSHSGQWSSGSRPTVAGNQVFAAGGYYGGLDAYDAITGNKQWFSKVNQQYGWIPAADEDSVYVYMGYASASPGPSTGTLYVVNRATGQSSKILNPQDKHTRYKGTVTLGQQNDALVLANENTGLKLVSFDLTNKAVGWRTPINAPGEIAINGGIVYASSGIELLALEESTGNKLDSWFTPAGESLSGNLIVTDNLIFAQTTEATYAIDRITLDDVWSTDLTGDIALGDGLLLISTNESVSAFTVPEPTTLITFMLLAIGLTGSRYSLKPGEVMNRR